MKLFVDDVRDPVGEGFTVVLKEDGTVWSTGYNNVGQLGNRNCIECCDGML